MTRILGTCLALALIIVMAYPFARDAYHRYQVAKRLDPIMSETSDVTKWLKFHTGAPVTANSSICSFAMIGDPRALPALDRFAFGSNEYPDRSTTLILQVESLSQGPAFELRGPGIDGAAVLQAAVQPADLFERLEINQTLFPRGIDVVLVADDAIAAIPRTTRLAAKGG